jgi:hypothetical protein
LISCFVCRHGNEGAKRGGVRGIFRHIEKFYREIAFPQRVGILPVALAQK